jgi:hypothetical protein
LIYSAFADAALAVAAIVAGADGLLPKTALAEELCDAIRRLFRRRQYFPAIPNSLAGVLRSHLQPRDQAIFSMLIDGVGPTEISCRLRMTRSDLEARRHVILQAIAPKGARARRRSDCVISPALDPSLPLVGHGVWGAIAQAGTVTRSTPSPPTSHSRQQTPARRRSRRR